MRPPFQQKSIAALAAEAFDVLVVGGGIVGAGIARDAALRGLKIGLVDRHDFAFGTSSRSSRLLHGGIRYLAQGRLGLVRQASVEKKILHAIAPHLAEPLAFIFPSYSNSSWPLWQLRLGVKIYDVLCAGRNFGPSRGLGTREVCDILPGLQREGLAGAVRYFDALTHDARLVLDTLRSAGENGAALANFVRLEKVERRGGNFVCRVVDELSGESWDVQTRCVVNSTGPWAQGLSLSRVRLRLTKGIHLVFDRSRLPVPEAVVLTEGSRVLFVIPWGERVIVGTTDTDYDSTIDAPRSEPQDVEYLLRSVNSLFPELQLEAGDVISSWAGLRPLIATARGRPSDISRSHQISQPEPGWWDVAGGKLTTYRLMAKQTVDQIAQALGGRFNRCVSAERPLLPVESVRGISQITPPEFRRETVEHFCAREWAVHLDDIMMRRAGWHYYHRDAASLARQALAWMGAFLGWTAERQEQEWQRYQDASDWPPRERIGQSSSRKKAQNAQKNGSH